MDYLSLRRSTKSTRALTMAVSPRHSVSVLSPNHELEVHVSITIVKENGERLLLLKLNVTERFRNLPLRY